jgi:hypothetical protein
MVQVDVVRSVGATTASTRPSGATSSKHEAERRHEQQPQGQISSDDDQDQHRPSGERHDEVDRDQQPTSSACSSDEGGEDERSQKDWDANCRYEQPIVVGDVARAQPRRDLPPLGDRDCKERG